MTHEQWVEYLDKYHEGGYEGWCRKVSEAMAAHIDKIILERVKEFLKNEDMGQS